MKTNLLFRLFLLVIAGSILLPAKAKNLTTVPYQFNISIFIKLSVKYLNDNSAKTELLLKKLREKDKSHICVCEIMDLQNNNGEFRSVALLSEKKNNGDIGRGYRTAGKILNLEKKHMKDFFFDHLKVNHRISATTDCISLYMKLSQGGEGIAIYDILDADIRSSGR